MTEPITAQWFGGPWDGDLLTLPPGTTKISIGERLSWLDQDALADDAVAVRKWCVPVRKQRIMWPERREVPLA